MFRRPAVLAVTLALALAGPASAACRNSFLYRTDGPRQIVTLLTGKMTYQEAQQLSEAIASKQAPALQWLDDSGKEVARQYGELKVVRPMPVRCDDKPSGVIMIATFATVQKPSKTMHVRFGGETTVVFDEQGR